MTRKQFEKHERISRVVLIVVTALFALSLTIGVVRGTRTTIRESDELSERVEQTLEESRQSIAETSGTLAVEKEWSDKRDAAFDGMSSDWGSDANGFVFYEIPEKYEAAGGYMPEKMQIYTYCLCKQEGVPCAMILAQIERESGYRYDAVGKYGEQGYLQIIQKYHYDTMKKAGVNDLSNPYGNVRTGVAIMKRLIEKYGTVQDALAAYNYGETGAREKLWNKGIYEIEYNQSIMQRMDEIEEELSK